MLAAVLGLSGLKLLDVPGTEKAIIGVLTGGLLVLLLWLGRQHLDRRRRERAEQLAADPPY